MRQWFFVLGLCVVWGFGAAQASEPGGAVPPASGSNDVEEDPRMEEDRHLLRKFRRFFYDDLKDESCETGNPIQDLGEALQNLQGIHSAKDAENLCHCVAELYTLWQVAPHDLRPDLEHLLSDEVPLFRDWRNGIPTGIEHFNRSKLHSLVEYFSRIVPAPQAIFAAWKEGVSDTISTYDSDPEDLFKSIFAAHGEEMPESARNALRGREVFGSLGAGNPCGHLSRVFSNTAQQFLGGAVDPEVALGDWDIYFQRAGLILRRHLDPLERHSRLGPEGLLRIAGAFAVQTGDVPDGVEDALRETVSNLTANQNTCESLRDALEQYRVPLAQRLSSIYAATAIGGILEAPYTLPVPSHPRLSVEAEAAIGG